MERISLRGICRVAGVSLCWLLNFLEKLYETVPEDLSFSVPVDAEIEILCKESDEIGSFVGKKGNRRWIWLNIERRTRQIMTVQIGDRNQAGADAMGTSACGIESQSLGSDR